MSIFKPGLNLTSTVQTSLLATYWDNTLTPSHKNPFPLAPRDIVAKGKVTAQSYLEQNQYLSDFVKGLMQTELVSMSQQTGFDQGARGIEIFGAGLLRDLEWLLYVGQLGYTHTTIRDMSNVACGNAEAFVEQKRLPKVEVRESDVESSWDNNEIDQEYVLFYYAGQFVQNQGFRAKNRIMKRFGKFLRTDPWPSWQGKLRRKVYLLHPLGEDNPAKKVKWRNTTPYTEHNLLVPLDQGFGGKVGMRIVGKHHYFHQLYSLICFSAPL